jgi:hypothetical protein
VDWGDVLVAGAEHLNDNLASDPDGDRDAHVPDGLLEVVEATPEQLEEIRNAIATVEDRTGKIERLLEDLTP